MPEPIRSVGKDIDLLSGPPGAETIVDITGAHLGQVSPDRKRATDKERSMLFSIWDANDKMHIEAQTQAGVREERLAFCIPKGMSTMDVAHLAHSGLIENQGNGTVILTSDGKVALSREIMNQPSEILKKKTRDHFIFSSISDCEKNKFLHEGV